jgi:hypothetical protein
MKKIRLVVSAKREEAWRGLRSGPVKRRDDPSGPSEVDNLEELKLTSTNMHLHPSHETRDLVN